MRVETVSLIVRGTAIVEVITVGDCSIVVRWWNVVNWLKVEVISVTKTGVEVE